MLRNAEGGGGNFPEKNITKMCTHLNVISVTRGQVGVNFQEKKRYVTLEWPTNTDRELYLEWRNGAMQ